MESGTAGRTPAVTQLIDISLYVYDSTGRTTGRAKATGDGLQNKGMVGSSCILTEQDLVQRHCQD